MTSSEYAEIQDAVERAWATLGMRGSNRDVLDTLRTDLPDHLREYLTDRGLSQAIGTFFRRKNKVGLAQAPEVDADGTHAQMELLSAAEFRYVIAAHVKAGKNEFRIAKAYALEARARLGVDIDLRDPLAESA